MKVITDAGTIDLGTTEAAPTIGIVDFSRRVTDDFGVTTVVERGFARRMSVRLVLPSDQVDSVQQQLAEIRATPALWVADERFEWLSFEGFYREFELDLALPPVSYCTLTVEGLTVSEPVADPGGDPAPDGRPSTLQLLRPVALTSAMLLSSNVPENDHPEWSAAVTYGLGAKVIKAAAHRVYESVAGGNVGNDPEGGSGLWVDIGPTNRWAMFDEALGTATSRSGSVAVTLDAGAVGAVALLDVVGATVRVQAPGYDETVPVGPGAITFLDLPGVDDAVTITVAGSNVEIGTLLVGDVVPLGTTEANPSAGINDFSVKETDEFGDVTIVERAWSKRMRARAKIRTDAVDLVANRIAGVRAKPSLWIGNEGTDSLTIYGFFRDFSIEVGQTLSTLELAIEGLSKAPPPKPLAPINWTDIVDNDPVNRPRPDDGADVTGENTSRDTENVNGKPADQVISELGQLEIDSAAHTSGIAAAEAQIADLFATYGDTASAAASAAAAETAKNAALDAQSLAEQARLDTDALREASQVAMEAAQQAETNAETYASNSDASAAASAGHATVAEAAKDDAADFASIAQAQVIAARVEVASLLPDRYRDGAESTFSTAGAGSPATRTPLPSNATAPGFGPVYEADISGSQADWPTIGVLPATPGRIYQLEGEVELLGNVGAAPRIQAYFRAMDENYNTISNVGSAQNAMSGGPGIYRRASARLSDTTSGAANSTWPANAVWLRPTVRVYRDGTSTQVQFRRLVVRDITETAAAAASADAAVQSEQAAATYRDAASVSAAASDSSRVSAEAAAASATEAAQQALAVSMPDRYITGAETNFTTSVDGSPDSAPTAAPNDAIPGWGPAYSRGTFGNWGQKGRFAALAGRVYEVEIEADASGVDTAGGTPRLEAHWRGQDASFTYVTGSIRSTQVLLTQDGTYNVICRVSDEAISDKGVQAWNPSSIHLQPYGRFDPNGGSASVKFKVCAVRDITSRILSTIAAEAASEQATLAEAWASDSEAAALASETARNQAETHAGNAETFSLASAQSAADAEGARDEAIIAQAASADSADDASGYASAAAGQASIATTKAGDAGNHASAAQASALTAETGAKHAVRYSVAKTLNETQFTTQPGADIGSETPLTLSGTNPAPRYRLMVLNDYIAHIPLVPVIAGRRYRFHADVDAQGGPATITFFPRFYGATGGIVGTSNLSGISIDATRGVRTREITFTEAQLSGGTQMRVAMKKDDSGTNPVDVFALWVEDVTESAAAAASASASQAAAAVAGSEAASATQQANLAAGYKGDAENAASAAQGFAAAADAHASTASSQAALAATFSKEAATAQPSGAVTAATHTQVPDGAPATRADASVITDAQGTFFRLVQEDERIWQKAVHAFTQGRTYRVYARVEAEGTGGSPDAQVLLRVLGPDYSYRTQKPSQTQTVGNYDPHWRTWDITSHPADGVTDPSYVRFGIRKISATATANLRVYAFYIEDVTDMLAAEASASVSSSSAASASSSAASALQQAQLTATYRDQAQTARTGAETARAGAETQAGIATSQAAIATSAASAAETSATLSASLGAGGVNKNGTFADYPNASGAPPMWGSVGGATISRQTGLISPYAARVVCAADSDGGLVSNYVPSETGQWWVIECVFTANNSNINGGGLLIRQQNSSGGTTGALRFQLSNTPDSTGSPPSGNTTGRTFHFACLGQITQPDNVRIQAGIYPINESWFGDINGSRSYDVHKLILRPATPAEIAAGTALPALQATVSTQGSVLATLNSQYASLNDTVGVQGVTITNHTSALATHAGNISTLFGRAGVKVDVGGRVTGWETNNNGQTGDFKIHADFFSIEKPGGGARMEWLVDGSNRPTLRVDDGSGNVCEMGYLP